MHGGLLVRLEARDLMKSSSGATSIRFPAWILCMRVFVPGTVYLLKCFLVQFIVQCIVETPKT